MRNGRAICLGVLCVLFITSTVFAQSQSATDTIIEKIYQSEIRVREHVDTKVKEVETKISAIDTKVESLSTKVETLSKDVTENKTNIDNMKESIRDLKGTVDRIWYGILGIFGTLILHFLRSWWENRGKKDDVGAVDRLAEQIAKAISAQAETSETRNVAGDPKVPSVEGLDELTDDRRSTPRDATGTV